MNIKLNIKYLIAFFLLLATEVIIAVLAKDNLVRVYLGDILVVVLIYCFIKTFLKNEIRWLLLYIFTFATCVEIGQYFNFVDLLGLGDHALAKIILGTTFDIWDIACYFIGCLGIWILEQIKISKYYKKLI